MEIRKSNIELLRIFAMLSIIAHHYVVNSGLYEVAICDTSSVKSILFVIYGAWGKVAINIFILITGYFMYSSNISLKKYIKLISEFEFYRIIFYFVFCLCGYQVFSIKEFIKTVNPYYIIGSSFIPAYFLLYLAIPFINIFISNADKLTHALLIGLGLFIYSIIGSISFIPMNFNYFSWFIILYLIGAYIRKYPDRILFSKNRITIKFIIVLTLSITSIVHFMINGLFPYSYINDSNKLLGTVLAIETFLLFENCNIRYSKLINIFAKSTFGVLLIHANCESMRQWLWRDTLKNAYYFTTSYCYAHAVISVLVVYLVCFALDFIRIKTIEKWFMVFIEKISPKFISVYKKNKKEEL